MIQTVELNLLAQPMVTFYRKRLDSRQLLNSTMDAAPSTFKKKKKYTSETLNILEHNRRTSTAELLFLTTKRTFH